MRLPRTETTLAAVLLVAAAPFALAVPPGATATPNTPGVAPPETTPSTTNPGMTPPEATSPSARQPGTTPGTAYPGGVTAPHANASQGQTQSQDLQRGNSMSSSGWSHGHAQMRSAVRVPKADIAKAKSAKVSLTDAINTAQGQNHGDVVSARFELHQGKPEYLIKTFDSKSQKEWLGHIDASTGKVIGEGRAIPLSSLPKEDQQELTASQSAGTTLGQAVQTAEQQRGGKALAAGLSARNGHVDYKAELLKSNGRTQMAMINPQSGQVSSRR
jgi:uncharacterized membrane protein YkoI